MNAQAALTALEPDGRGIESAYCAFRELFDSEGGWDDLSQVTQKSAVNDDDNDTSSVPVRLPSTFTRLKQSERIAPKELAEWNGCVTSVENEGMFFSATLCGVKGLGVKGQEEDANIPISDVAEWDKELLLAGNFFRLCVMQGFDPSGQPIRYTKVIFRRLPAYRQQDLDEALERGRQLARGLRVE